MTGPEPSQALFWWLRSPTDERQLTDCLGGAASVDRGVATGLVRAVLLAAVEEGISERARGMLAEGVPPDLTCTAEDQTGRVLVAERRWWRKAESKAGRIDWVFHPAAEREPDRRTFQLAVEVKINARLESTQLRRYDKTLQERGGRKGLLLLSADEPRGALLDDTSPNWLGVVRWGRVLDNLVEVRPDDKLLARQWPVFLSVLRSREDLGVPLVEWSSITAANAGISLKTLLGQVREEITADFVGHLTQRDAAAGSDLTGFITSKLRASEKRQEATLSLWVHSEKLGQLTLRRPPKGRCLELETAVDLMTRPLPPSRRRSEYDRALDLLGTPERSPRFQSQEGAGPYSRWVARRTFTKQELGKGELRPLVRQAIRDELRLIASSGVIDQDLRRARK